MIDFHINFGFQLCWIVRDTLIGPNITFNTAPVPSYCDTTKWALRWWANPNVTTIHIFVF